MPAVPYVNYAATEQASPPRHLLSPVLHLVRRILSTHPASSQIVSIRSLESRQTTIAIPTVYAGLNAGPAPGTVVGITLGSVVGFLLLVWLFSTLSNSNRGGTVISEEEVVVRRRSRSPRRRSRARSEMTSRSPRPERVIRQERTVRETSRVPPPRRPGEFIVEERTERRVDGDDIVEVIEEQSSVAPKRKTKRSSGYRSVDPALYAGGNYPRKGVR